MHIHDADGFALLIVGRTGNESEIKPIGKGKGRGGPAKRQDAVADGEKAVGIGEDLHGVCLTRIVHLR